VVKVNKISPRTNCGTVTVGDSGDSVSVTAGVPVTVNGDLKSNALKATDGGSIISQSGTSITIGASGDTVSLASGATQSGFGRAGSVDWQTGAIKTSTFTAASGEGYFVNTTSGVVTVNLPAGSAGAIVAVNDYAQTAATNNITIAANGSEKIQGSTNNHLITTNGVTVTLVYVDSTQGWKLVDTGEVASLPEVSLFTTATGGTITECGDYKIHTFTGPGTFCVSQVGNAPTNPSGGPNTVSYLVVAGGGTGGYANTGDGGGGAGGFREGRDIGPSYTASPLVAPAGLTIAASPYSVTVGGGGSGSRNPGSNSVFSTITSAGGGAGANNGDRSNIDGGSGGGGRMDAGPFGGGCGNVPPVSPPQGNNGGTGQPQPGAGRGGGGGGAGAAGGNISGNNGGPGGNGVSTSITGSSVARAGGGGGGNEAGSDVPGGTGGGGIGTRDDGPPAQDGTVNTGGGGGGDNGNGGSGIVVIRYKFQ
jgi:hypothetical protein